MASGMTIKDRMERGGPVLKALSSRFEALINAVNGIIAERAGESPHKINDVTNIISLGKTNSIDSVVDLEQELIDDYEAHIGSTTYHAAGDSTNVVTELGVVKEIYTLLNELKVDYAANRINVTSHHGAADSTNIVTAANATSKSLAILLANDLHTNLLAHMALTAGTVHGAADAGD